MTFDVKIPKWLAWPLVALWVLSLVQGLVCGVINAKANLHYLASEQSSPPPPYPGQPATAAPAAPKAPALPDVPAPDDKRKRPLRPHK